MNKLSKRKEAKSVLLARVIVEVALCTAKAKVAAANCDLFEGVKLLQQAAILSAKLKSITRLNFKCLRPDGRIDPRRYRRFYRYTHKDTRLWTLYTV